MRPGRELRPGLATASTSGSRTGSIGEQLGILDVERAVKLSGSMFVMYRGAGATAGAGPVPAGHRPQRGPLRGDPPADAGAHRHDGVHRPPAEVRRRGVPHRTRRPVGHPHRRGAAHLARPRRDRRRGRPARCGCAPTPRASAARPARRARTPAACCGSTSSTRSSCSRTAPPSRPPDAARRDPRPGRVTHRRARPGLPDPRPVHRRHRRPRPRRTFDIEVYAPGVDDWLEVSSVSWFGDYQARRANLRYRPDGRQGHRGAPHPQRLGPGRAPGVGGASWRPGASPTAPSRCPSLLRPYMRGRRRSLSAEVAGLDGGGPDGRAQVPSRGRCGPDRCDTVVPTP